MCEKENSDHQTSSETEHVFLSNLSRRVVECVGPAFLSFWQSQPGITSDILCLEEEEDVEDTASTVFDEDDVTFLRSLDPKLWKHQDHYAVLGLSKLRHKGTDEDIKRAYRIKVLHHHPDKRKAKGEEIRREDDYFTCITKAWEVLGNPRNRRSFDSVDPLFDDEVPSNNEHSKSNFYAVFGKVFEENARWSEKQPVPKLEDTNSTREHVEKFYSFWYNFESWREYSYLDEEEKEKGQAREERRWIDKQNKAARARRKKDEMTRIRSLVDLAYDLDPRVQKFKQEDKDRKLAAKQARKDAARARVEEEERKVREAEEAARKVREEMEAEEKAKQDAIKAERDAQKKALKKEKTALRKLVKANNYYVMEDNETVKHMAGLEKICECLGVDDLAALMKSVSLHGRDTYVQAMQDVEQRIEKERHELMDKTKRQNGNASSERGKAGAAPWTQEQLQLLIKAVNIFPAGTNQRWEVVANFINQHNTQTSVIRTAKEVLAKAKDLQSSDYSRNLLKTAANEKAYDNFEKVQKCSVDINATTSQRFDGPAEQQGGTPWTAKEQQLLEQALKSYPASTPDRWDRIAECVPSRSKKECLKRFRDLAEMVKAKKAAQAAAQKGK